MSKSIVVKKNNGGTIAQNKRARHDYFIEEKYEAGIVLHGTEVKSMRLGKCSIKESFIKIEKGEVIAVGPGKIRDNGQLSPMSLKVGNQVVFKKYSPDEIKIDGEDYLILSEDDVVAIIE